MNFKEKFFRFVEPLKTNKGSSVKTIIYAIVSSLYGVLNVYFIQYFMVLVQDNNTTLIHTMLMYYLVFNLMFFIVLYSIKNWNLIDIYYGVFEDLIDEYMTRFISLDNTKIEGIGTGKIISILQNGFSYWADYLHSLLNRTTGIIISFVGSIYLIAQVGVEYLAGFLVTFVIVNIALFKIASKTTYYRKQVTGERIKQSGQQVKMIMSKFEILQNDKTSREVENLNTYTRDIYELNKPLTKYMYFIQTIPDFVIFLVYVSILGLFGVFDISIPQMVGIFLIIGVLQSTISRSIWIYQAFVSNFYDIEKLWDFYDTTYELKNLNSGEEFKYKSGDIELKDVSFGYSDDKVFRDFSLKIKGGQKTALVGMSGSGKTTLVKLISGFLQKNSGQILIDGQNIDDINLKSYYKEIGYLTQEPSVFDGSIEENLIYGAPNDLTDAEIDNAIKESGSEFVYDLKDKLKTQIGERGIRLSGGQRQRLAIAKLFLKNPRIIILDEPTSALDSLLEDQITHSFEKLFRDKTVIIIAHRLQTVKDADEIIVIDRGHIVERGNHSELLKKGGYYHDMIELQSGF